MQRRATGWLAVVLVAASCGSGPVGSSSPGATDEAERTAAASRSAPASPEARSLGGKPLSECRIGAMRATEALCGELTVPEDPAQPDGRTLDLHVAVIPALSPAPEPDPVFMLAGGPGGAATESLAWAASTFTAIHTSRDIVLVDQRGTGGSNALLFGEPPDLSALSEAAADAALRDWTVSELARFDADPRFYTTSVAMDDLDLVRDALGYERINLFGASYGATAAQYYIRQHGDRLRTVILDGGSLLDVPLFEMLASNSAAALDQVFERCAAVDECAAAYPDLPGDLDTALAALAEAPVRTAATNPATNEPVVIDAGGFTDALHTGLLNTTTSALIPWFIHAAAQGLWDDVAAAALAATGGKLPETDSPVMSAVIRCSEAWAAYDPAEVARLGEGSYYLAVQLDAARQQEASCLYTPKGVVPANDAEPARTDVPVLLVVGSGDPQDPPANIADAPADFPNSLTVVAPGHGHTVAHLGCLPRVVDAFVEAGTAVGLDTSCVDVGGVPLEPFRLP